ncbi:MAG TPA: DNA gyrase inhibitor YacG [Pyrinomonadaceae bacterium]|nr:DNA gyrase inhibitor YacG [Pyrinomonadaceae bacterium]
MKCPTCDKEATWEDNPYRPFCSERCKLVDLGKWVNDEYRVPGREINREDRTLDAPPDSDDI